MTATACSASLLLVAKDNAEALLAQLQSLVEAGLPDDVELVVAADAASPAVGEALATLSGRVRILTGTEPVGRRAALASAAAAAESDVCVALGPLARVAPDFLEPLVAAVRAGAGLAAPVLDTSAGPVHGYRLDGDGGLTPLGPEQHGGADALALDCLAAPRELWQAAPKSFDHWRDLYEVLLARVAAGFGPLAVVPESRVRREGLGPPLTAVVWGEGSDRCAHALEADGVVASGGEILTANAGVEALDDALARARNDVVAVVDGSTRPGPGWTLHLAEAFLDPGVALARGPVRGLWPDGSDPNRFPLGALGLIGIVDRGDADADLGPGREGGFPNLAVRRDALRAAGGLSALTAAGGEAGLASVLAFELHRSGARCRYAAQAAVGVAIPADLAHDALAPYAQAFRAGARDAAVQAALGVAEPPPTLAARLTGTGPLPESLGADNLFTRLVQGPGTADEKLAAVRALGMLAASAVARGRPELRLPAGAIVRFEPRHAAGEVAGPGPEPQPAAAPARVSEPALVSCVIPVYNLERYVGSTIQSVLAQRYPAEALDIVVVDDGSTDRTAEVCAQFGDRIRYVRQENAGVIAAVDRGVREARGELIGFLDADDQWLPDKTRRQADWLRAHPGVGLLYGDMELIDEFDRTIHASFWGSAGVVPYRGRVFGNILRWNFVTTGSMLARASLREAFCPMPAASPWQDWGIAAAIARVAPLDYLPEPMFRYRSHGENHALGAEGERLARAHEKDLRFRRAMLASLAEGELAPHDLRAALHGYLANADRLARARSMPGEVVLPVVEDDRVQAAAQLREAVGALAAGRLEAGFHGVFGALVRNPLDEDAHALFEAAYERLCRGLEGRTPRPLEWPADVHAAERLLADCAGLIVVGHAAELIADEALLASFSGAFEAGDATLVALSPDVDHHELFESLEAAVARAGLDRDGAPDVVLFDAPASPAVEERLAARAHALLTRRTEASALGSLPLCDDAASLIGPALGAAARL